MIWFRGSSILALAALLVGLLALPAAWSGTPWSAIWRPGGVAVGVRLDVLAAMLMAFVGLLGWVVSRYSTTNLSGRNQSGRAGMAMFASVASLLLTVTGASLVTVALGWTLSGLAVAGLVARAGTREARTAARTMRRTLLLGDAFLWSGVVVGQFALPSLERTRLMEIEPGWAATLTAALLLGACVARTGLVPAHRWLPETTEAPSPVSALLHAGVVNGAGVLVLLAWPLFSAAPLVLACLLVLGCASVVVGAWSSRVRADVKGRLACSTTSQMGYMCIQLGLGLPVAALLHLMGHGAYKSWLFLRAGGAVGRARAAVAPRRGTPSALWGAALVAGGLGVLLGLPAALHLVQTLGLTTMLPLALSTFVAGLAGYTVAGLRRLPPAMMWGVVATAGVAAGLYTWLLLGAEKVFAVEWQPEALWGPVAGGALVLLVAAVLVVTRLGHSHLEAHPVSALAVWLLPTALMPARRQALRGRHLPLPDPAVDRPAADEGTLVSTVVLAASVVGPAWPLRNFVAASTLARLQALSFDDALLVAEQAHGVAPRPSLRYFLDLFDARRITVDHLHAALAETGNQQVTTVDDFLDRAHALVAIPAVSRSGGGGEPRPHPRHFLRRCEAFSPRRAQQVTGLVDAHAALWAQRAWPSASSLYKRPDAAPSAGPWYLWRDAALQPGYDRAVGVPGATALLRLLPQHPAAAIDVLAGWLRLADDQLMSYLVATFASAPGWSGHAAWRADRTQDTAPLVELAAVRMAHDVLFSRAASHLWRDGSDEPVDGSREWPTAFGEPDGRDRESLTAQLRIWQRALEMGIEGWLVTDIAARAAHTPPTVVGGTDAIRPTSQSLWCIDVRSERLRRELEALGGHHTYGFAGFFGAAARHVDADGIAHDLCPALISPSFTAREQAAPLTLSQALYRTLTDVSKDPLGALLVAEAGGGLAALASSVSTLAPRSMRRVFRSWTQGSAAATSEGRRRRPVLEVDLDLNQRVAMAAGALVATGLTTNFAPVIVICAHASSPENNAFATAYDCGACGGNHGVVNAVLVADALNDPAVRAGLAARGLVLPQDTVAVAAVHDTTIDVVELLPAAGMSAGAERAVSALRADLRVAGLRASGARRPLLPSRGRVADAQPLERRAADWSEPTPEWGLAGNAAIVIGPRTLTAGADLQGRVFLHSYERDADADGAVLEQLLTAPLVVAQWINAQYYFSAVAPTVMGAGDKTTHNVIGDVGVIRGAHGDLRTGLPWQALFHHEPGTRPDAVSLVHPPVRLLGVVVADPAAVLDVVTRHDGLGQLVCNEWIHLVCVDRGRPLRLRPDLGWQPM